MFNILQAKDFPNQSIYQLDLHFYNQNEKKIILSDLSNKVQILSMIYTNCQTTCPIIINNMQKIEKIIPENIKSKINFTLISLDPKRDTPLILKNFAEKKNINLNTWTLLNGDIDNILELAISLGIKYKKEDDGNYIHSNLILLIDKDGIIQLQHPGLIQDYSKIIAKINDII